MLYKMCMIFIDFDKLIVENVLKLFIVVLGNNWVIKDIEIERVLDFNILCFYSIL